MLERVWHEIHRNSSRGQSLLEFALILPVLMLVVMGTLDLGRAVYIRTTISNAAREGAHTAIISSNTNRNIMDAIESRSGGLGIQDSQISINPTNQASRTKGTTVTIGINYPLTPMTPMLAQMLGSSQTLTLTASATMVVE